MIYFIQNKSGFITLGSTRNIDTTLNVLAKEVGEVELLGVMPGNENDVHDLIQEKFGIYKIEGIDEWYIEAPELLDFIDENTTLEPSTLKPSARYKTSDYTPIKQQALSDALRQQINLVVHIEEKWQREKSWYKPSPYLFFDLNAGPGISKDNQPGSPVIFSRIAADYTKEFPHFRTQSSLYETDPKMHARLVEMLGNENNITIYNASHDTLFDELKRIQAKPPRGTDWMFGTVYADPSNATLPWDLLELMNEVYPRVDVMINIACASYKRSISQVGYQTLADRLPRIKKQWIVRKPYGKHQWSILIGSNWTDYPAWSKKEFYPWNDNGIGTAIFDKLVLTPKQIRKRDQLSFLDDFE